jgi:hypothetical protein
MSTSASVSQHDSLSASKFFSTIIVIVTGACGSVLAYWLAFRSGGTDISEWSWHGGWHGALIDARFLLLAAMVGGAVFALLFPLAVLVIVARPYLAAADPALVISGRPLRPEVLASALLLAACLIAAAAWLLARWRAASRATGPPDGGGAGAQEPGTTALPRADEPGTTPVRRLEAGTTPVWRPDSPRTMPAPRPRGPASRR